MNDHALRVQGRDASPQTVDSSTAIEIEGLTVNYGKNAILKGLNLVVPVGSIFGFLGANGAGKTTTIKTLLGFRPPNGGSVRVLGYDVLSQQREICCYVSDVSETNSLYGFLTTAQLCDLSRDLHRRWNQDAVDRYIQMFELPWNKRIKHFSKGMKSQLALCLALGNEPDLLILLRDMQKMLSLVYTEQPPAEELTVLRSLPGVCQLEQEGRILICVRERAEGTGWQSGVGRWVRSH